MSDIVEMHDELTDLAEEAGLTLEEYVEWHKAVAKVREGLEHLDGHYTWNVHVKTMMAALDALVADDVDEAFDECRNKLSELYGYDPRAHTE